MIYDSITVEAPRETTPAEEEGMSWTEDDEGGEGNCIDEGIQDDEDNETMID